MNRYVASTPPGLVITALLLFGMQKLIDSGEDAVVATGSGLPVFIMRVVELAPPDRKPPPPPPIDRFDPPLTQPGGPAVPDPVETGKPFVPPGPPVPGPVTRDGALPPPNDGPLVAIVRVAAQYPPDTTLKGIEGHAVVEFDVEADGTVSNARVIEASHRAFGKSALRAVAKFRYRPRIVDGTPVATRQVRTRFRFVLEGDDRY